MSTGEQARAFLAMMLCGVCAGMAHDLFAVLRRGTVLTAIADLLLGLLCAGCVIGAGLLLGCDPFRLYTLIGVLLGWMIYSLSLGTIVRILTQTFGKLSKKVAN